jgi:predicted MFS family arabinose efflux permease
VRVKAARPLAVPAGESGERDQVSRLRRILPSVHRAARGAERRAEGAVGGRARLHVVALLAAVVGLDGADKATISVNAGAIESVFGVDHAAIGLLVSVTSLVGAVFTLPVGVLTDRVNRTRLLSGSIVLWAVATLVSGLSPTFQWLLVSRATLGAVTATAGPTVAALFGDFFPARERARIYGYVLAGELVGTGIGFVLSSGVASMLSWRASLAWVSLPALLLAWLVWRLPEPARNGQDTLDVGQERVAPGPAPAAPVDDGGRARQEREEDAEAPRQDPAKDAVARAGVTPNRDRVLQDASALTMWAAFGYVLRTRTVLIMIVASSLGYFFLAGVRAFATLFATDHYGVGRGAVSGVLLVLGAGAIAGVLGGGRLADRLLSRGRISARVLTPSICLLLSPVAFAPGIATTSVLAAIPLLTVGAGLLAAANPPLDAARLDVVPARLWGRAESVRTFVRTLGEFTAPLLFGYAASDLFGHNGLMWTFLLSLVPLWAAGLLGLAALRSYPRDVATSNASDAAERARD